MQGGLGENELTTRENKATCAQSSVEIHRKNQALFFNRRIIIIMGESLLKRIIDSLKGSKFINTKTGEFLYGVLTELDTVTWPTKDEIYNSTIVVLITVILFAMYSGLWDFIMNFARKAMFTFYQ